MIPKANCKNRRLYRIHSRNLAIGVFNEATGGFLGLRKKFGNTFVFEEYHWENESFATVQPQVELPEELPGHIELKEQDPALATWLHEMVSKYGNPPVIVP